MHQSGTDQGYSRLAKLLHWVTALIIFAMIPLGLYMVSLAPSPFKFDLYYYHKSFGMLVLGLVCVRLGWRVYASTPAPLTCYALWELYLSRLVHVVLYALLFSLPVSGWLMSSAGDFPVIVFGLDVPHLLGENEVLFDLLREIHEYAAFVIAGLVILHLAGALKHHFADRDITLKRMLPGRGGMILLGIVLAAAIVAYSISGYLLLAGEAEKKGKQHEQHDHSHSQKPQSDQIAARGADKPGEAPPSKDMAQWQVLTKRSQLTFKAYQQGSAITGHFGQFSGSVAFDSERPRKGRGEIVIDLDTVDTGTTSRDDRLKGETWFYTSQYPQARYVIRRFERREGEGNYIARGKLHLRGQSASVDLPFHLAIDRGDQGRKVAHATGQTQLKRLNYGVGQGKWRKAETIANKVDVEIDVYAVRQ